MSNYGMTASNFLRTLPTVLQNDPHMRAMASAIAVELDRLSEDVRAAQIYTRIDELDESMLDALAADFKVDWWRPDASLDEKRYALKVNWYVHKHLGTKSAIETAVADYLGSGKVEEWFEYGGQPHHFRVASENNTAIITNYDAFISVLEVVQRRSSVLEHITAILRHLQELYIGTAMRVGKIGVATTEPVDVSAINSLSDELGNSITDELGNILIDGGNLL
ncbi:MAG: phage tail protein [Faecousia sp.]